MLSKGQKHMNSSPQAYRPDDFSGRMLVAGAGALALLVLALIAFGVVNSWIPGVLIILLIPVHVALSITDTNVLDNTGKVPARVLAELKRLFPGSSAMPAHHSQPPAAPSHINGPQHPSATPSGTAFSGSAFPGTAFTDTAFPGPPPSPPPLDAGHPPPSRPIPLWSGHSFDPPGPHGPSVVHGFGSYGKRNTDTAPASDPGQPPTPTYADGPVPDTNHDDNHDQDDGPDHDDDPDMTIQRPTRH